MKLASFGLLAVLAPACGTTDDTTNEPPIVRSELERDESPDVPAADAEALVAGNSAFAANLYQQVRGEEGNLFMSPHSISIALAMTYAGANGNTATQMADALSFELPAGQLHPAFNDLDLTLASRGQTADSDTIPFRLNVANSIWGQDGYPFQDPFLDTLAVNYGAGMHVLDFQNQAEASRLQINDWVMDQTNDKIEELIPQGAINSGTRLVLTNAVYFSAAWAEPFEASATTDASFTTPTGPVTVATMHASHEAGYGEGAGWKAAELVYDGGELSMVIVVPDDLAAFEASLSGETFAAVGAAITNHRLDLSLPKFEFDAPLDLKEPLQALGMTDAFDGNADFSGIDGTRNLAITDVLHKGFVSIDENGTEAAAATAVIVGETSVPEPATLNVDKPFVFFIKDIQTGAILFVGRVVDPTAGE